MHELIESAWKCANMTVCIYVCRTGGMDLQVAAESLQPSKLTLMLLL